MVHCRNTPVHQCTSAQGISYVYIAVAPSIAGGPSWFSVVNFSYIDSLKISTALSGLALLYSDIPHQAPPWTVPIERFITVT
jgi:hypothetical protein